MRETFFMLSALMAVCAIARAEQWRPAPGATEIALRPDDLRIEPRPQEIAGDAEQQPKKIAHADSVSEPDANP